MNMIIPAFSITGNQIIDWIIWCLISTLTIRLFGDFETLLNTLMNRIGLHRAKKSIYAKQFRLGMDDDNLCFCALSLFVSEHSHSDSTELDAERHLDDKHVDGQYTEYSLHREATLAVEFENETIHIRKYEEPLLKDSIQHYYAVYSHTETNDILKRFVDYTISEYRLFHEKRKWKPLRHDFGDRWMKTEVENHRSFDNVILEQGIAETLRDDIERFFNREEWYRYRGIPWNRGYLLYGPPGTGKTSIIKAVANEFRLSIYMLNLSNISSDTRLAKAFSGIPKRCLLVIEDIDRMTSVVTDDTCQTNNSPRFTLSGLLNELDGMGTAHGRILIVTTNNLHKLDSALIRPGRIDMKIRIGYATTEMIHRMFKLFYDDVLDEQEWIVDGVLTPAEVINAFMNTPKTRGLDALGCAFVRKKST